MHETMPKIGKYAPSAVLDKLKKKKIVRLGTNDPGTNREKKTGEF